MSVERGDRTDGRRWRRLATALRRRSDLALALAVASIVAMMVVPLPTIALDLLITTNLAIAVTLLIVAIYVGDALRFATFPAILLVTTLFRLGLNVSSTRLILLQGDAGRVIAAFGQFVVAGNYVVGAVVFLILLIVQFVVIAKGSERVAEVAARFTLDALPGKQLAIDSDLRSGLIDREEARRQRRALQRESQFYGAMDGAMKFVKGDAVAGIVITVINIVAGLAIGVLQRGMALGDALRLYGLLTIGDGLVSQIPALVISTAAGLVVTRVASEDPDTHLGEEIGSQVLAHPRALLIVAGLLALLGLVPGLPLVPFLTLAALCALLAAGLLRARRARGDTADVGGASKREAGATLPEPLALRLAPGFLATRGDRSSLEAALGDLVIELGEELGIDLPAIRVSESSSGDGPAALLIDEIPAQLTPLDDSASVEDLVGAIQVALRRNAHLFVGVREVQARLAALRRAHPDLVRAVVPEVVDLPVLTEIFRRLVAEGVSVRNVRVVLEALLDVGRHESDPVELTEHVRRALARQITHGAIGEDGRLDVFQLSPDIEDEVRAGVHRTATGTTLALDPELVHELVDRLRDAEHDAREGSSLSPVVLASPDVRRYVRALIESDLPDLAVLSPSELDPSVEVHRIAWIEP